MYNNYRTASDIYRSNFNQIINLQFIEATILLDTQAKYAKQKLNSH